MLVVLRRTGSDPAFEPFGVFNHISSFGETLKKRCREAKIIDAYTIRGWDHGDEEGSAEEWPIIVNDRFTIEDLQPLVVSKARRISFRTRVLERKEYPKEPFFTSGNRPKKVSTAALIIEDRFVKFFPNHYILEFYR